MTLTDPTTTDIYTLSLHDALPISSRRRGNSNARTAPPPPSGSPASAPAPPARRTPPAARTARPGRASASAPGTGPASACRSEEHTSELQSRFDLVCRLLLEKQNET